MQYKPNHTANSSKKRIALIIGLAIVLIVVITFSSIFIYTYLQENKCKSYISSDLETIFKINKSEYSIISSKCDLNAQPDKNKFYDVYLESINNSLAHVQDTIKNCTEIGCEHTLCISSEKPDEFYMKLTDYVCTNRVNQDGSPIIQELEFQRKLCHTIFESKQENKTIFSVYFPPGTGAIQIQKGNDEC